MTQSTAGPLISVVIPTFNHLDFLRIAIESVIAQTYGNWEIVVIDNHSTDGTSEYLQKLENPRIRIESIENGGSIAKSRNLGVDIARGDWVAFLDSDDWWTVDKLEIVVERMRSKDDFFFHRMRIQGESSLYPGLDQILGRRLHTPVFFDLLLKGNPIATSSVVLRRDLFIESGGMNEGLEMKGVEDFNSWLKISRITENFVHIDEFLGFYRIHTTNVSVNSFSTIPLIAVEEFLEALSPHQTRRMIGNFEYVAGRLAFLNGNKTSVKPHLLKALINGRWEQKLKSGWMFISLFWRRVFNDFK
jgi:glycosyltransferase involved in cell wall biosynthesis